jgi:rhodanese-related sulfurtransferase
VLPNNKEQKILCYCRRGGRSLQATDILRHAGFANTYSMDGGIEEWDETER